MARPLSLVHSTGVDPSSGARFLGPYLLSECIGRGGTAMVYRGTRRGAAGFEKEVVIKTILPELAGDPSFLELFTEEAKLSAQLFHTNIAQVQDFGVLRGTPFLELELLSGWNVKQLWDQLLAHKQRLPVPVALQIVIEACRGLAYAHAFVDRAGVLRPIIHRDISPANVMICRDGTVKLIDFGLASVTCGETLKIDTFRGKVAYMSPEQVERGQIDRSADVFALGVVLHELLTGRRLFARDTDLETVRCIRAGAVRSPSRHNDAVPRALDRVVLRALAQDPAERYRSAVELLAALEQLRLRAATRGELLAFLGGVAPEVYSTCCEACGAPIAQGSECQPCRTIVGESPTDACPGAQPRARHLALVRTPPRGVMLARETLLRGEDLFATLTARARAMRRALRAVAGRAACFRGVMLRAAIAGVRAAVCRAWQALRARRGR